MMTKSFCSRRSLFDDAVLHWPTPCRIPFPICGSDSLWVSSEICTMHETSWSRLRSTVCDDLSGDECGEEIKRGRERSTNETNWQEFTCDALRWHWPRLCNGTIAIFVFLHNSVVAAVVARVCNSIHIVNSKMEQTASDRRSEATCTSCTAHAIKRRSRFFFHSRAVFLSLLFDGSSGVRARD